MTKSKNKLLKIAILSIVLWAGIAFANQTAYEDCLQLQERGYYAIDCIPPANDTLEIRGEHHFRNERNEGQQILGLKRRVSELEKRAK